MKFLIYYLNSMLVNSANIDLPTDDKDHQELNNTLSNLENEQLKYIREYWFSKQIDATREFDVRNPNLSVENLYNKRKSNNHQRLSLRQIVKYDLDLFTTFFPVVLTTPDVCSNLFRGKNQYFDIVMFDEASQLKLEDNLPALLKAKQIIIAGDEHQMPPSNYFSKIFDGTIDDEDDFEDEDEIKIDRDNILLSCESLLDFASELSFEKKYLDFHYRSRHPFLIDFSNYAFYGQRLKPLPNGFEYTPIKYIKVNGTYSDHTNEVEAETVLSIIENNINRLPNGEYPSVGIATFNIHQRNLILGKINDRRKFDSYAEFNEKILELEENGLFVKNLENIQGDERDVIILTTTYGINLDGKFAHRFGSINHQKGYKLLNVIITRAKYKIYVCSSIPEEVFLNYKEYLSVEGSNKRRAVFFAYLAYCKSVSDNDAAQRLAILNTLSENTTKSSTFNILNEDLESPFEEEVYQALTEHFDKDQIIIQYKFAGFRIDLVYESKINGVPKIAIESDGAAYHSSQEAYLYDRHRQKILEGHGFIFHRIWGTNWWRNQKRETKILVEFIKNIENSKHLAFEDKSNISLAFTDNIAMIENEVAKVAPILQKDLKETIEAVSGKETEQTVPFKEIVKLNSIVEVKYLNNQNNLKIKLVAIKINNFEIIDGIKKININSPLAGSILGKSVGDTVKIGNLDNYVEILEIVNE
ncbi:MAG: GreA/GreB family elongation factor [Bacteroidetes bacterium]|nr:GreA/GreB family elongation factor [Bacteroidota bacterium]